MKHRMNGRIFMIKDHLQF